MADGSVKIPVELDDSKAYRDLDRLKAKINKLQNEITKNENTRASILPNLQETYAQLDEITAKVRSLRAQVASAKGSSKRDLQEQLSDAREEQSALNSKASQLEAEYARAGKKVETLKGQLGEAKDEAGALEKSMELNRNSESLKSAGVSAKGILSKIGKYALGITSLVMLFRILRQTIVSCFKEFAAIDSETQANVQSLKQSLAGLRASWGAAFAPIVNAVVPILQRLISWLTAAANAVASFVATICGRGTFKKAIANTGALANNMSGAAGGAKELKKQLAGFDELEILNDEDAGGGGGAGSGISIVDEEIQTSALAEKVKEAIEGIKQAWNESGIKQAWEDFVQAVKNSGLPEFIEGRIGLAITIVGMIAQGIIWTIADTLRLLTDLINGDLDSALNDLKDILVVDILLNIAKIAAAIWDDVFGTDLVGKITEIQDTIREFDLAGWIDGVIERITNLYLKFSEYATKISDLWTELWQEVHDAFNKIISAINKEADENGGILCTVIDGIAQFVLGVFQTATNVITAAINLVYSVISTVVTMIGAIVTGQWSTACNTLAQVWSNACQSIGNVFRGVANTVVGVAESMVNSIIAGINRVLQLVNRVSQMFGGGGVSLQISPISFPRLAKGGIVDSATMFMAGEAGKEAVIPLERNTEWISLVADGLIERITQGNFLDQLARSFMKTPIPAMASGAVLPPNAASMDASLQGINSALNDLKTILGGLQGQGGASYKLYLDGKELHTKMALMDRQAERASGI